MPQQKSIDYKETPINYYLVDDKHKKRFVKFSIVPEEVQCVGFKNIKMKEKLLVMLSQIHNILYNWHYVVEANPRKAFIILL